MNTFTGPAGRREQTGRENRREEGEGRGRDRKKGIMNAKMEKWKKELLGIERK